MSMANVSKIKIDLSEWNVTDWASDLASLAKVTRLKDGVEISIDVTSLAFEKAAEKIAREAIEGFFSSGDYRTIVAGEKGLVIHNEDINRRFVIPYDEIPVKSAKAIKAIEKWIKDESRWLTPALRQTTAPSCSAAVSSESAQE